MDCYSVSFWKLIIEEIYLLFFFVGSDRDFLAVTCSWASTIRCRTYVRTTARRAHSNSVCCCLCLQLTHLSMLLPHYCHLPPRRVQQQQHRERRRTIAAGSRAAGSSRLSSKPSTESRETTLPLPLAPRDQSKISNTSCGREQARGLSPLAAQPLLEASPCWKPTPRLSPL